MKIDFSQTKLFTILIALLYISGLIGVYYNSVLITALIVFLILCFLILCSNLGFKKVIILCLLFFVGFIRAKQSQNNLDLKSIYCNNAEITGKIISTPDINNKNKKVRFYVLTNKIKAFEDNNVKTKILISLDENKYIENKIKLGDYITLKGKLRTPDNATNPYQFDYRNYLLNNDCTYVLYGDNLSYKIIGCVEFKNWNEDSWYFILRKFDNLRNKIIKKHSKYIKSPRLEILAGLVFGNETVNPDENIKENFKNSGLLHLLAASGLNVALIFGIWWQIANLFKLPYRASIVTGCFFIIFYTFMTGFPPSILRAGLMLLFVLIGKLIDRKSDSIALIFFVGFLILLFCPKMLFDIGFQLSFAVTFGLISCSEVIISKFREKDKFFKEKYSDKPAIIKYFIYLFSPVSLISIISIPLIAQLWVVPLQMYYFNTFTPFSLFANIAVIPFIAILSFVGFLSSILALIPYLSDFIVRVFDYIANPLLALLIKISEIFSSFKYSLINTISLNIFQIFCFWILILMFVYNLEQNFKNKKRIIAFCIVIALFCLSFFEIKSDKLEIIMFDVGNADSFLIKTPKNKYILIDTGRLPYKGLSSGETIINRYLKNKRINSIEKLIITHYDADHAGGAVDILKSNYVKSTILQNSNKDSSLAHRIPEFLDKNKMNYSFAKNNEIIYTEPDLTVKTLVASEDSDNESSTIALLTYKNKNILFMADAGTVAFGDLKEFIPKNIDILKLGHHGALGVINSEMLEYLSPKYVLISTGVNKFNHPHPETIDILNASNIKTVSTKNYGFSLLITGEKDISVFHFDKLKRKMKPVVFDNTTEKSFDKSEYMQNLIKKSLL